MKIVYINYSDTGGGAPIAALRHAEAMSQLGHYVKFLVVNKNGHNKLVEKPHWGIRRVFDIPQTAFREFVKLKICATGSFSKMQFSHDFYKLEDVRTADVIILHWVNFDTLNIKGVEKILQLGKPTFWYMHDMFPITGGCHHSLDCNGYKDDCKNCKLIGNQRLKIIAYKQLKEKIKNWGKYKNLEFIAPSIWLTECATSSKLVSKCNSKVHNIPNVINTDIYRPLDISAKEFFGLNSNKKTILFGAISFNSVYKGSKFAFDCLKQLDPDKYEGLIIGNASTEFVKDIPMNVVSTGYLTDDLSKVIAYNACDTFIIPSLAENYPNVVLEAMACGKPCVGFRTGGIPDLIKHEVSGLLTINKSANDLYNGVLSLFSDNDRYKFMSDNARQQILACNSYKKIKDLYENAIDLDIKD